MARKWFLIIVLFCLQESSSSLNESSDKTPNEPMTIKEIEENLRNFTESISKWILPKAYRMSSESKASLECNLALFRFIKDVGNLKEWALKMLDATAKPAANLLEGTFAMLGDYDECLDIVATNRKKKHYIQGEYCLVKLGLPESIWKNDPELWKMEMLAEHWKYLRELRSLGLKFNMHIGVCVPSQCTARDVNQIAEVATKTFGFVTSARCQTRTKRVPNTEQTVVLCVFVFLIFLAIIGTIADIRDRHSIVKTKSELSELLKVFSFYSNTILLLDTRQLDHTLPAIRGCRVLSSFWIILVHTYVWPTVYHYLKYRTMMRIPEFSREMMFKTILGGVMAIDSFFLISGTLFAYSTWKILEKNKGWINPLTYVPIKMARLLPILMFLIALTIIFPLLGNGPIWDEALEEAFGKCKKNWWITLLFVQNFWNHREICMLHTWYLSALFQLLLLASVILLVLYRWPKIGISMNVLLILIGAAVTGVLTLLYNLPTSFALIEYNQKESSTFFDILYLKPYSYLCSLLTGVLLGYSTIVKRNSKIKPCIQFLAWLMSTCGALSVLYSFHFFGHSKEFRLAYAALHRTVWSLSLSWILFACFTGRGGIIEKILSWTGMITLDRMVLFIYLLHPFVLTWYTARIRATIPLDHTQQVFIFLATIVITVCLSFVICVTFAQPMNSLPTFIAKKMSRKEGAYLVAIEPPHTNNLASIQEIATSGDHASIKTMYGNCKVKI